MAVTARTFKITAMPGLCDVTDFGLSDEEVNKRKAKVLLYKKKEVLWETETHIFFRTGDWASDGYLVLYNKTTEFIAYLVKFVVKSGVSDWKKVVTQVSVWRSFEPATSGFAKKVFFEILLPRYKAIMSDSLQTARGRDFWIESMALADSKGYKIAFIDRNKHTIDFKPENISMHKWIYSFETWGEKLKHEGEKFLIAL